jgi:hypothetical protein
MATVRKRFWTLVIRQDDHFRPEFGSFVLGRGKRAQRSSSTDLKIIAIWLRSQEPRRAKRRLIYRTPQIPALDSEIAADFLVIEHMRLLGRLAHLFDRDRIEIGEKGFPRLAYGRIDHPLKEHRV